MDQIGSSMAGPGIRRRTKSHGGSQSASPSRSRLRPQRTFHRQRFPVVFLPPAGPTHPADCRMPSQRRYHLVSSDFDAVFGRQRRPLHRMKRSPGLEARRGSSTGTHRLARELRLARGRAGAYSPNAPALGRWRVASRRRRSSRRPERLRPCARNANATDWLGRLEAAGAPHARGIRRRLRRSRSLIEVRAVRLPAERTAAGPTRWNGPVAGSRSVTE